ncbi:hypothetical protein D3C85_968720 [compost metagenome]
MRAVQRLKQLRGQQHRATLQITFRWQRQGEVRFFQSLEQIQADMPMAQLVTGQSRRQQHQRIIIRCQFMKEGNEGFVQRAQPATLDPAREQQQQIVGAIQRGEVGQAVRSQRRGQQIGEGAAHSNTPCSHAGSAFGSGLP